MAITKRRLSVAMMRYCSLFNVKLIVLPLTEITRYENPAGGERDHPEIIPLLCRVPL